MSSPFETVLSDLSRAFSQLGLPWYVFGAQAAIAYGARRLTADVDVTVLPGSRPTAELARAFERNGFELRVTDREFLDETRVLPFVHAATRVPVDAVLGGPGLEERFAERAVSRDLAGVSVPVARVEDVVVMKILAGRSKDLDDIEQILLSNTPRADDEIEATLAELEQALGQSDLLPVWRRLRGSS